LFLCIKGPKGIWTNSRRRRLTLETAHHAFKRLQERIMWCDLGSSESRVWREEDLARIFRGTINSDLHFWKFPVANGIVVYRISGTEGNRARYPKLLELSHREFPFHLNYPPGIFGRMVRFSIFVKDFSERCTTRSFPPGCWKFCSENTVHVCEYSVLEDGIVLVSSRTV